MCERRFFVLIVCLITKRLKKITEKFTRLFRLDPNQIMRRKIRSGNLSRLFMRRFRLAFQIGNFTRNDAACHCRRRPKILCRKWSTCADQISYRNLKYRALDFSENFGGNIWKQYFSPWEPCFYQKSCGKSSNQFSLILILDSEIDFW